MCSIQILPDERIEELSPGGFRILQKQTGFHYTMDAVLLADFARIRPTDHVLDFGTGTGILPLLCISRKKGQYFEAFEIQSDMAEMAKRTMEMNGLKERVTIHALPVEQAEHVIKPCSYEHVIANPPYGMFGTTLQNPQEHQRISRHQDAKGLASWMQMAFRLLKGKGRLSIVYPASQLLEVMTLMRASHLEPKRFRLVYPLPNRAANLVLIEAIKDGRPTLQPEPPLIVHHSDGSETDDIKKIYRTEINTCSI